MNLAFKQAYSSLKKGSDTKTVSNGQMEGGVKAAKMEARLYVAAATNLRSCDLPNMASVGDLKVSREMSRKWSDGRQSSLRVQHKTCA